MLGDSIETTIEYVRSAARNMKRASVAVPAGVTAVIAVDAVTDAFAITPSQYFVAEVVGGITGLAAYGLSKLYKSAANDPAWIEGSEIATNLATNGEI